MSKKLFLQKERKRMLKIFFIKQKHPIQLKLTSKSLKDLYSKESDTKGTILTKKKEKEFQKYFLLNKNILSD